MKDVTGLSFSPLAHQLLREKAAVEDLEKEWGAQSDLGVGLDVMEDMVLARVGVFQRKMVDVWASSCWSSVWSGAENHLVAIGELWMLKNSTEI